MATFTGQAATNNTFTGTSGADLFQWAVVNLDSRDRASGAGGTDTLRLTTAGVLSSTALKGVAGIERIALAAGKNGITLLDANYAGVAGAKIVVTGNTGTDAIDARRLTGANAIDVAAGAGLDALRGGAGRDTFRFTATNLAGDTVLGGGGADQLVLTTSGALLSGALTRTSGVETIQFASGGNAITLRNGNFTDVAGGRIAITGSAGNDGVNASALGTANAITVRAGAGADRLVGGAGGDLFIFKAADLALDRVDGRGGADRLAFADAGTVSAAGLNGVRGVETFALASGGNAITMSNTNFIGVAGAKITVIGGAGGDAVDARGLKDGNSIDVTAGGGNDVLRGGAGADVFRFVALDLTSGDTVQGGAGYDTLFLTTAGTVGSLAGLSGLEEIVFATGGNAITLADGNTTAGGASIRIRGSAGPDTVNASAFTAFFSINVTAGAGADVLRGGAGSDDFRFGHDQLTAADTVAGGDGYDELRIETAGALAVDALANVTGIEAIYLATGNTLKIADANFAVPLSEISNQIAIRLTGESSSIDGSAVQTSTNGLYVYDNGGIDAVIGGAGVDVLDLRGGVFVAGDTFDGGGEVDTILFNRSMDLLGTSISNVERLLIADPSGPTTVNISGENAAGFARFGSQSLNGVTDTFNILLSEGSTTNLANLAMLNREVDDPFTGLDEGDAINVISSGGTTAVTLSVAISRFTGSEDSDTVGLAFVTGRYRNDVVINAGGGDDRIAWDSNVLRCILNGGTGTDTLVMSNGSTINLESGTGPRFVIDFENVDASASNAAVTLTGRDSFRSVLTGGSGGDTITAGAAGAWITGGQGVDTLTGGAGGNRFFIRSTTEAQGDTIIGSEGYDSIEVLGDTDLTTLAAISNIDALILGARDAAGTPINANVTATMTGGQAEVLTDVFGTGSFPDSTETLVVQASDVTLDLSNLNFFNWSGRDLVVINGTSGADVIIGTSQNDVIAGANGGGDTLSGGGGNDLIGYDFNFSGDLDGGEGNDTIRLDSFSGEANLLSVSVELSIGRINEFFNGSPLAGLNATSFENADFSLSTFATVLSGTGGANVLIGGSAGDQILGRGGADTLTGGEGADLFVWSSVEEGGDTITDFTRGEDKLQFDDNVFFFSGSAFDTVRFDSGSETVELDEVDLFVASQTLDTADAVRAYLDSNSTSTEHALFVVAPSSSGSRVLYYTSNASASGADNEVFQIADLGEGPAPALGDFVFI